MCLHSLKLLQEVRAGADRPARPAQTPAGHKRRGTATLWAPRRTQPAEAAVSQERAAKPEPGGAGSEGGARRRRSRGLATGNSQWEREPSEACAPPARAAGGVDPARAERAGGGGEGA